MSNPAKWGLLAYIRITWLISLTTLIRDMLCAPAFSAPIELIILAQLIPLIAVLWDGLQPSNVLPIQVAVLLTNTSALAYIVALYYFQVLQVIPVARYQAIQHLTYVMIVLDAENRLVKFNPSVQALPGLPGKLVLRKETQSLTLESVKEIITKNYAV